MSKLVNWGRRFSQDCFLCYGGATVLIAIGGVVGNLRDWPPPDAQELYFIVSFFAVSGIIFLTVAYALFKSKRWGARITATVSGLALALIASAWLREPYDPEGFGIVLSFSGTPLLIALLWALLETKRELNEGQRNQIA